MLNHDLRINLCQYCFTTVCPTCTEMVCLSYMPRILLPRTCQHTSLRSSSAWHQQFHNSLGSTVAADIHCISCFNGNNYDSATKLFRMRTDCLDWDCVTQRSKWLPLFDLYARCDACALAPIAVCATVGEVTFLSWAFSQHIHSECVKPFKTFDSVNLCVY